MKELREFAQHKTDFDQLNTRVLGISVDDQSGAQTAWNKAALQQFPILSDTDLAAIRAYGLVHASGRVDNADIAIRATILVDENGSLLWRRASVNTLDTETADDVLARIRQAQ
jgi:peroxiredoxin